MSNSLKNFLTLKNNNKRFTGFSLIEVLLAIGIISISFIPLLALLPIGLKDNEISIGEIRGLELISTVAQDLRYTPSDNKESILFKLKPLPYSYPRVGEIHRYWIDACWNVYNEKTKSNAAIYELTIIYTNVPHPPVIEPIEAIISITWPPEVISDTKEIKNQKNKDRKASLPVSFPHPNMIFH